jgi:hypothetical protein
MDQYITYNVEFQLAICVTCQTGLPSQYVLRHMRTKHKDSWKAHGREMKDYVGGLTLVPIQDLEHPTEEREPVDGLMIKDGWICGWNGCVLAGVSRDYIQTHCRNAHGAKAVEEKSWYQGLIQTLLGSPYIK